MNQKTYKKITSLYHEGLKAERIIRMLIELSPNSEEAAKHIMTFIEENAFAPVKPETLKGKVDGPDLIA